MEFEPMLTPREKSPLPKMSPEEDRTRNAVTNELFRPRIIFILRMTVLGRGLIFQPVPLACKYNNDTIITFQKKN